ncbi:MAG: AAA family ATPase [Anaerolineae bacterium]|nr:AAA family ATPase [Anaerolineae bacterium]
MSQPQNYPLIWSALLPRLARFLPANLFNGLRALPPDLAQADDDQQPTIAAELLKAVRALDPLHRVLIQYMPRYLLERNPEPGRPHGELLAGSFIFADVTGFTALTELLARQGQGRGHEAMNQIMNSLFSAVLDPLIASGGDLLVFVGDAALVYFPQKARGEDVLQATRAALRMERAITPFASFETEFGRCSLTMSAGVERGLVYAGIAGDSRRMELLISGPGIFGATAAEKEAEPGQVRLGEQARAIAAAHFTLNGSLVIDDWGDALGDYEISLPTRRSGGSTVLGLTVAEALETLEITLQRVERLAPFLPEDMLARLVNTERQRGLPPELRPVAVQFVNLVGLERLATEHSPELATRVFQRFFMRAQEIVNQHEGVISQVDAWSEGFILVNTFGTPRAHEGTTSYAVSAALQLSRALDQINREFQLDPPLSQCSGITYGLIFTGEIGAKYRRESVIAGPAVNRAARLMSKAQPGQIILDFDIWAKAQSAFVGDPLPPVTLKGIDGPVVIVNVREIRRGTRLQPLARPLLNREAETSQLAQALDNLLPASTTPAKKGSAWLVSGETGLGKTTLMSHLAEMARQRGLTVLVGRCQPHGKHIPLLPWTDMLTGWLDLDEHHDPGLQRVRLAEALDSLGLTASEKVLANLLGLPAMDSLKDSSSPAVGPSPPTMPPPSLLSLLSTKTQASPPTPQPAPSSLQNLLQSRLAEPRRPEKSMWTWLEERVSGPHALLEWLKKLAGREPVVVILEDIDWLDHDSTVLLHTLLRQITRLPILLAFTGHEASAAFSHVTPLPLDKLPPSVLVEVAQRTLGAGKLDEALAQWICGRAGGNPLYVVELCEALRQADAVLLDRQSGEARWTGREPALPLSLHGLLLARLDELPLPHQEVLKRAAVLGQVFEVDSLMKLCRPNLSEAEVGAALETATQASFLNAVQATRYQFNHPLLQEAIYTTLGFSQRQRWHTKIADGLVESQPEAEQNLELIAYHYIQGAASEKAARFGRRAGDKARERGAYAGAAEYYAGVLGLAHAPLTERAAAAEGRADVLALQGDYQAAAVAYSQAVELGSVEARGKQAILTGQLEGLAQTEFTPMLQGWAEGARAWLLAQQGQSEAAAKLAQAALTAAEGTVRPALETLLQTLKTQEAIGNYEEWLAQFAQKALSQPVPPVNLSLAKT